MGHFWVQRPRVRPSGSSANELVQCWRESTHISGAASGNTTLGDCMMRGQHLQGGEHQRGLGEVSYCGLCRAKTVRRCFCACTNILLMHIFCRCLTFVDANILLMPVFYQRLTFVNANTLSMPNFCQRIYFVDANIFSTPRFCQRQYFVGAYIKEWLFYWTYY